MKTILLILFLSIAGFPQQYHDLFATTNKDTAWATTLDSAKVISQQITFLKPYQGIVGIYGSVTVLSGADTSVTVRIRKLAHEGSAIWSPDDSIGVITEADSTFFFPISERDYPGWGEVDALIVIFEIDTTGTHVLEFTGGCRYK